MTSPHFRIFISYSHRGKGPEWKTKLLRALHLFEQHHLLDVWQDGKIRVSAFWDDDIKRAMDNARLAVVLLTPEALDPRTPADPNYILETEFPFLRERQQRDKVPVFPVVCEDCNWHAHDWLRATQAPNESNPLSRLTEPAQDCIFRGLATAIAQELSRLALIELRSPSPLEGVRVETKTYLDKFPLTRGPGLREEKLIGREQELALLDLAFAQPRTAIVSLVAWGGVGKTMLVQHWLQRLQREGWFGTRRVYAWSFYSQGTKEDRQASEDTFLAHALEWFGVQCEPTLSPWDKGRLLADAVARERTLLILDGIEPLQYPPGPMGGQLRAPGVQSLLKHLARRANSARAEISNHQSQIANCLCLVTTREPLTDLADFQRREGSPWGSMLRVDLGNLTDEAGAALLHHAGANRAGAAEIKPDDKELIVASREVDGHALTLNLLGRFLARAHSGDIRRRDLVKFEEADRMVQGGATFKMLSTFENWFANEGEIEARALTILRMLGLFDSPADAGCLSALCKPPVIPGLTESLFALKYDQSSGQTIEQPLSVQAWNDAVHFLAGFGLVAIQSGTSSGEQLFECHPLIRDHFRKHLRNKHSEGWLSANRRVYGHLKDSPRYQTDSIERLHLMCQAGAHGCRALMLEESFSLFKSQIDRNEAFAWRNLGAFNETLSIVTCFLDALSERIQPTPVTLARPWFLNEAALCLRAMGRISESAEKMRASLGLAIKWGATLEAGQDRYDLSVRQQAWSNAAIGAVNLSEMRVKLGLINEAIQTAEGSVAFADHSNNWQARMSARATLADAMHQAGNLRAATLNFQEAEAEQKNGQPQISQLYSVVGFHYCDLLLSGPELSSWRTMQGLSSESDSSSLDNRPNYVEKVEARARKALSQSKSDVAAPLLDCALNHLTLARLYLYLMVFQRPAILSQHQALELIRQQVTAAFDYFRGAGTMHELPLVFLTRAWFRFLKADAQGAQADLDEAWDIAERGPMRLYMADIHLYRARLFFREKEYPWREGRNLNGEFVTNRTAADDLAAAEKLINECGYHRRDEELADAKRAILDE